MIKYEITKFPIGFVSKALAQNGGAHIYSTTCADEDLPNGVFVGKGKFIELDHYAVAEAGTVTGKIQGKAANGNYYVEIDTCDEGTLFVSNVPVIAEQWTKSFQKEENYYNAKKTELRSYQLKPGDVIELNAAALGLSADPSVYPVAVSATAYGDSAVAKVLN